MNISNVNNINKKNNISKTPFPSFEKESDVNQVGTPDYNPILIINNFQIPGNINPNTTYINIKTPFSSLEKESDVNQVGTPDYNFFDSIF